MSNKQTISRKQNKLTSKFTKGKKWKDQYTSKVDIEKIREMSMKTLVLVLIRQN